MANSVDPDQTAPIGTVCSESTLFASMLNSSVMLSNYLHQTTSADDISRCIFSWRFKSNESKCTHVYADDKDNDQIVGCPCSPGASTRQFVAVIVHLFVLNKNITLLTDRHDMTDNSKTINIQQQFCQIGRHMSI